MTVPIASLTSRRELLTARVARSRSPGHELAQYHPLRIRLPSGAAAPDRELHLLRRITFGPKAHELQRARAIGWQAYLEQQLDPDSIDDGATERLIDQRYPEIHLPAAELYLRRLVENPKAFVSATLLRAIYSERQLFEVMVDFWSNHFHIFLNGDAAFLKIVDDREVIRPHALGRFRDLLHASAKSPAMLFYLDNYKNIARGPNENYARELMELHTLGVDGGYTQQDVEELARVLTGWTYFLRQGARPGEFLFKASEHAPGTKVVLGQQVLEDGMHEGELVLDYLAGHPSTARFVATKLCRRFVADEPPAALVDRAAATFAATDGDIRAVLRTILTADEFFAGADLKVRRPLEFVVAVMRALEVEVSGGGDDHLKKTLELLGQLPFQHLDPDGFADVAEAWVSSDGLLTRWNFVLGLVARSNQAGLSWDLAALLAGMPEPTARSLAEHLVDRVIGRAVSASDFETMLQLAAPGVAPTARLAPAAVDAAARRLLVYLLDSPYFQLR